MKYRIRNHTAEDIPFLKEMLFEAAYWRPETKRPSLKEGLSHPELRKILSEWGRSGDTAIITETVTGEKIGAAWYRFWTNQNHSFGYIAPQFPEIGIAVNRHYRRRGIGNALLAELIRISIEQNIKGLCLSVENDNPARFLYQKHQFRKVKTVADSWTMIRSFDH